MNASTPHNEPVTQLILAEDGDEWFVAYLKQDTSQASSTVSPTAAETAPQPAAIPAPVKKKRHRKTKQEYAEQVPLVPKEKDKGKGGRPKMAEDEKLKCVSTLVSPARYTELNEQAKRLGLSVSELLRPLVDPVRAGKRRGARAIRSGFSLEERQLMRQVAGVIGNVQLVAKHATAAGLHEEAHLLNTLIVAIRATLQPKDNG